MIFNQTLFHILVTPTLVPRTPVDEDAAIDILSFKKIEIFLVFLMTVLT